MKTLKKIFQILLLMTIGLTPFANSTNGEIDLVFVIFGFLSNKEASKFSRVNKDWQEAFLLRLSSKHIHQDVLDFSETHITGNHLFKLIQKHIYQKNRNKKQIWSKLNISNCNNIKSWDWIEQLPKTLININLSNTEITNSNFCKLLKKCPNLETLNLSGCENLYLGKISNMLLNNNKKIINIFDEESHTCLYGICFILTFNVGMAIESYSEKYPNLNWTKFLPKNMKSIYLSKYDVTSKLKEFVINKIHEQNPNVKVIFI